ASNSGMPIPTSAPVNPPTAPPAPRPASAAMIGPAAMNGPSPGIARAPIPASNPNVPPTTPPATAPLAGPPGTLVAFAVRISLSPPSDSGSSTDISDVAKPDDTRASAPFSAPDRVA